MVDANYAGGFAVAQFPITTPPAEVPGDLSAVPAAEAILAASLFPITTPRAAVTDEF